MSRELKRERPKRKFTGERKGPLHFNISEEDKKEFHYRVVNDVKTRIADLQEMDYELVEAKPTEKTVDSANVRNRDNSLGVGGGITARLMRIPKEWWEENQEKTTIKRVKEHDAAMKASSKKEGQYGKIEFEEVKS